MAERRLPNLSFASMTSSPARRLLAGVALPAALLLALNGCVGMVVGGAATGATVAAQERSVGDAVDDLTIRTTLNELFLRESLDLYNDVSFSVVEGRVLLKGAVLKPEHRIRATQLAWRAAGVREVINEIQVTDQGGISDYATDTWISTQLKTKMLLDKDVLSINYNVETVNGTVYLMGIAQDQKELDRVIMLARNVPRVTDIVSHVVMKDDPSRVPKP
ncbi:MAG: BON domain-containing protein [Alphaproteobacteria bacterium]